MVKIITFEEVKELVDIQQKDAIINSTYDKCDSNDLFFFIEHVLEMEDGREESITIEFCYKIEKVSEAVVKHIKERL